MEGSECYHLKPQSIIMHHWNHWKGENQMFYASYWDTIQRTRNTYKVFCLSKYKKMDLNLIMLLQLNSSLHKRCSGWRNKIRWHYKKTDQSRLRGFIKEQLGFNTKSMKLRVGGVEGENSRKWIWSRLLWLYFEVVWLIKHHWKQIHTPRFI